MIKNLKKMKSKQDKEGSKKDVQAAPAAAPAPAGSASGVNSDFLSFMAASKARESDGKAKQKDEIKKLVEDTNPGKSAEELLAAYDGREGELVSHLKKLKKSKRDIV